MLFIFKYFNFIYIAYNHEKIKIFIIGVNEGGRQCDRGGDWMKESTE